MGPNKTEIECCKCGIPIDHEIDGYDLCPKCYAKAVENQRLFFKELAQWVKDNHLFALKVTLTERQEMPK